MEALLFSEQLIKRLKQLANQELSMGAKIMDDTSYKEIQTDKSPKVVDNWNCDDNSMIDEDIVKTETDFEDTESSEEEKCDEVKNEVPLRRNKSSPVDLLCRCAVCITDTRGRRPSLIRLLDQAGNDPCFEDFRRNRIYEECESDCEDIDFSKNVSRDITDSEQMGFWDKNNKYHEELNQNRLSCDDCDSSHKHSSTDTNSENPQSHLVTVTDNDLPDCSLQISKLLVVDPKDRFTAADALAHPFFKREETSSRHSSFSLSPGYRNSFQREQIKRQFFPRRMFKAAVITILALHRIKNLHLNPPPISIDTIKSDPYSIKTFRKIIDAGAFRIYGHWVKKGENQNRAALFENVPKKDLKSAESEVMFQISDAPTCVLDFEVRGRIGRKPVNPLKIVVDRPDM